MTREYKVRDFAQREQVAVSTVRRWLAKGAVEWRRTPGGHVRIIDRPITAGRGVALISNVLKRN